VHKLLLHEDFDDLVIIQSVQPCGGASTSQIIANKTRIVFPWFAVIVFVSIRRALIAIVAIIIFFITSVTLTAGAV
jgi:hypothetical protein